MTKTANARMCTSTDYVVASTLNVLHPFVKRVEAQDVRRTQLSASAPSGCLSAAIIKLAI
eukprot:scaffold48330_cov25-Prasinocladus_malaysianus.AAC.1